MRKQAPNVVTFLATHRDPEVTLHRITTFRIMKIEYDPIRDLLYVYFAQPTKKAAQTITIMPGVYADFDSEGKIMGIEVIDASQIIGDEIEFKLPEHAKT